MVQCPNCLAIGQTIGTNCTNCGRPITAQQIPTPTPTAPTSGGAGKKKGFFARVGATGSRFRKKQKEVRKSLEEGKEKAVSGAKFAYQRPLRRLSQISWWIKPLFIVLIILIIAAVLLGFNVVQFGYLSTFGGLIFLIGGVILIYFGLSELSKTHNIGYLYLIGGLILSLIGLYIYGLFSTVYLYIAIAIVVLYILVKSKLSSKNKFLIISGLAILALIFFFFPNIISFLLSFELLKWIIFLVLFLLGFWLIFKKDQQGKYSYRFVGLLLIIVSILLLFLSTILSVIGFDFKTIFSSFRWLIIGFLGVMLLISLLKGKFTWAILFFILILVVWFLGSESGSLFLSNLGVKAQVAGGETFSARLGKYWNYIKNPEAFFARYGEFGNPNIEIKAPVGLKIEKFEPLIKEYRSIQELRFTGEIKHYGLPVFKQEETKIQDNSRLKIGVSCYIPEEKEGGQAGEPYYADEVTIKPGSPTRTNIPVNNLEDTKIKNEQLIEESLKFKNFTKFVTCKFNAGKVPAIKDKETRKAYLNVSYHDFITRSDVYVYLLGQDAYDKIERNVLEAGGDLDNEFLYELRNAASYPGLIDNERRTVSEFSSGPAWLQVSVYDQQPLRSNRNDYAYTLIVRSKPNSVDWIGAINIKDIYLVVPSWFTIGNDCAFSEGGGSEGDNKRLTLKVSGEEKKDLLRGCSGEGASCAITCDFTVNSQKKEQNIQEYRISAYQITDYSLSQGVSFEYIKSKAGGATAEEEAFMKGLYDSFNSDDWRKLLDICEGRASDRGITDQAQVARYRATKYCTFEMTTPLKQKLYQLNSGNGGVSIQPGSGSTASASATQPSSELLKITEATASNVEDSGGDVKFNLKVTTNKAAVCKRSLSSDNNFNKMTDALDPSNDKKVHTVYLSISNTIKELFIRCKLEGGSEEDFTQVTIRG